MKVLKAVWQFCSFLFWPQRRPKGKSSVLTGLAKIRKYRALDERGIEEEEEQGKTINKENKYL
jgi:hypothetical protein